MYYLSQKKKLYCNNKYTMLYFFKKNGVDMLKKILIKLSGEAIGKEGGYNDDLIISIVKQIKYIINEKKDVSIVIGGGNIWRGQKARPDMDRVKADQMGMLAIVINAIYISEIFKLYNVNAKVMTPIVIGNMTEVYEKNRAIEYMKQGTVIINAAGLGHPYFSSDTVAALRAAELKADCILYAKNIDGVYEQDPKKYPSARKFKEICYEYIIKNGLDFADISAMDLLSNAKIPAYVFDLEKEDSIKLAADYPDTKCLDGTYINYNNIKESFYE